MTMKFTCFLAFLAFSIITTAQASANVYRRDWRYRCFVQGTIVEIQERFGRTVKVESERKSLGVMKGEDWETAPLFDLNEKASIVETVGWDYSRSRFEVAIRVERDGYGATAGLTIIQDGWINDAHRFKLPVGGDKAQWRGTFLRNRDSRTDYQSPSDGSDPALFDLMPGTWTSVAVECTNFAF